MKVGQVVLWNGQVYLVESPESLGGKLRLVPIKFDPDRQVIEASETMKFLDYATRRPVQG